MYTDNGIFKKTIIYFVMIFCACGSYMLAHSTFPKTYDSTVLFVHVFDYASYALALVLICIGTYEKRELISVALIASLLLISALMCGNVILVKGLLIVLASKEISTNVILKTYLINILMFGAFIVTAQILNFIPDVTEQRANGLLRHSLGFSHPNRLGMVIMLISLLNLFWKYKKYNLLDVIFNVAALFMLAFVANSKTALVVVVLVLLFEIMCFIWHDAFDGLTNVFCWGGIIIAPVFSIVFTIKYNADSYFQSFLNELFTGRLYLANKMYQLHGFSLLGQEVKTVTALEAARNKTEVLALDNFYAYLGIQFGIIVLMLLVILVVASAIKIKKRYELPMLFIWIALVMIYGIMENQIIDFRVNFTMVLFLKFLMSGKHYMNDSDLKVKKWA